MSDNKKDTGNPDRQRISLLEEYEVRDWAEKFGVSADELKKAVAAAGHQAKDVESYLQKNKSQ